MHHLLLAALALLLLLMYVEAMRCPSEGFEAGLGHGPANMGGGSHPAVGPVGPTEPDEVTIIALGGYRH